MPRKLLRKLTVLLTTLMLCLTVHALAATRDEALTTARQLVGQQAELLESDEDDGVYEFEFRDDAARYDVGIRASDGAVIGFETEYAGVPRAASAVLTEAEAKAKAVALYPDAAVSLALPGREDGGEVYEVFFTTAGAPAELTVNAETGDIQRVTLYPAAAGAIPADRVLEIVRTRDPGAAVTELELDYDRDGYRYEGETAETEFGINALTGDVLEWEKH